MIKKLFSGAALCALSTAAFAGDLPSRASTAAPASVPAFTWTGFYAGAFVGGAEQSAKSAATYGALGSNNIGFGAPGANGSVVTSNWYNAYATGDVAATRPRVSSYAYAYSSGSTSSSNNMSSPVVSGTRTDAMARADLSHRSLVGALGLQAGAYLQKDRLVMGVAGDFSWFTKSGHNEYGSNGAFQRTETVTAEATSSYSTNTSSSSWATQTNYGQSSYSSSTKVSPDWMSTLRLTAGLAHDRWLGFASGGLAFGSVQTRISSNYGDTLSSSCAGTGTGDSTGNNVNNSSGAFTACGGTDPVTGLTAGSSETRANAAQWNHSSSKVRTGYVLGGGLAYAMSEKAIVKLEAYYYDLGAQTVTVAGTGTSTRNGSSQTAPTVSSYTVRTNLDGVLGRVGLEYKY